MSHSLSVAYGSHMPVLARLLAHTTGAVLELGSGVFSTPFLHAICGEQKRQLVTIETDPAYVHMVRNLRSPLHTITHVTEWDAANLTGPWDIALVDHAPEERRATEALRLLHNTRFIVLHDTQPEWDDAYHFSRIYHNWPSVYHCNTKPRTTVLSYEPLNELLAGL